MLVYLPFDITVNKGFVGTISWFKDGIEFHVGGIDSLFNEEII